MKGVPAVYLGRIVEKEHFRVFIYGFNGDKKLIESWDDFEAHMENGLWFSEPVPIIPQEELPIDEPVIEKPKRSRKSASRVDAEVEVVKDDDFLPKAGE